MTATFTRVRGRVIPLDRADVDTDQIIAARHLKRLQRSGFGAFAFEAWRSQPDCELEDPRRRGAVVLIAGPNFGCGSSREHATWALHDLGLRVIIAPSFADIFRANCAQVGLLAVTLDSATCRELLARSTADPLLELEVDLAAKSIAAGDESFVIRFEVDPDLERRLLLGLDAIAATLAYDEDIRAFEAGRPHFHPVTREGEL